MKPAAVDQLRKSGWDKLLLGIARKVAPGEQHYWADMVQEGWLRLMKADGIPTTNPSAYYRMTVRNAMVDFLRREKPWGPIVSFARAKHLGLLRCPACNSRNVAWSVSWPQAVRCRDCIELFNIEEAEKAETLWNL